MEQQRVLILMSPYLLLGGVGENMIRWMETYAKQGVRVIWLSGDATRCYPPWKQVMEDCGVEIRTLDQYSDLDLSDSFVTAVSFFIKDYFLLCSILAPYDKKDLHIFYMVPNLNDMNYNFLEVDFQGAKKEQVVKRLSSIHERMNQQGRLLFFHPEHITTVEEAYGIQVLEPKERLMVRLSEKITFEEELAHKRSKTRETSFRMITCGRFDFPFKGYIIGLVREYALLKPRYPQLKLEIIGYGPDQQQLLDVIASLSPEIAQDITLHGAVDYKELQGYFDQCHLNIGTGGAVRDGAITGIPSIPITDICAYTCEVSGFFLGDKSIWSKVTDPLDVKPLIEEAILATEEAYLHLCRKAYDTFADEYEGKNQNWLLDQRNHKEVPFLEEDILALHHISHGFLGEKRHFLPEKTLAEDGNFIGLQKQLMGQAPCYLWGAGLVGARVHRYFQDKMNIVGFMDGSEGKQKDGFCGLPVVSPSFLEENHPIVVVATNTTSFSSQVFETLLSHGYEVLKDCLDTETLCLISLPKKGD